MLLAYWGVDALLTVAPQIIPRIQDVRIDASVLLYTLTISVATGLIFGLIPAVQSSKPNLNDTLKETSRGSVGGHRQRSRHALIVAEVAVSLVLLIGATLTIRSFVRLQRVNPGFDPQHVLAVTLSLPQQKYPQESQRRGFVDRVLSEIRSLPGVESAGVGHVIPFMNDYVVAVVVDGQPKPKPGEDVNTNYYAVSPDYFKAMGIPVIRGRTFTGTDSVDSPRVAVVSQSFVKRFYGNEDPIGKQIQLTQGPEAWRKIVGIVGDVKTYGLDRETTLQAYEPYNQMTFGSMTFVVRTATDPATFSQSIRSRILSVDKDQPVTTVRPMNQTIAESVGAQKFSTWLLTAFAGIALVLATVGLYGMMSYLVTQRTHEIGLRMALGAQRRSVFQLVIRQGLLLTIIGLVAGLAGAFGLTRLMSTMLYEVSATDPATFVVIPILLASVSVLACYIPARRAMKVDPMVALRYE